jgi:histidine triad (HIT) family protein
MDGCIFCKIIKREIPGSIVLEDDHVLAFLDVMPVNRGHCLVIPKGHYETLQDVPDSELPWLIRGVKKAAKAVKKAVSADGYNVQMNNFEAAGQVVPHAHFHIVPRFSGDGLKLWPGGKYREGEMQELSKKISSLVGQG